jgi:hypothetical protein
VHIHRILVGKNKDGKQSDIITTPEQLEIEKRGFLHCIGACAPGPSKPVLLCLVRG